MQKLLPTKQSGLTIIELTIVISIILILAGIAIPSLARGRKAAQIAALGDEFRTDYEAFVMYAQEHSSQNPLPLTTPGFSVIPSGMEMYMPKKHTWLIDNSDGHLTSPQFRGRWFWLNAIEHPMPQYPGYNGFIMFGSPDISDDVAKQIDERLDDGDISTGALRYQDGQGGYKFIYFAIQ